MLSDEFIKEIRDSIDLSNIINRKVKLEKRGRNFLGLCPFHNEKTPSFNVNDEEGYYHCFGCGAHGDSISFIRNFENKSFMEAVETIASFSGITLPVKSIENDKEFSERKTLLKIIELATNFYVSKLFSESGKNALKYLYSRGLTDQIIQTFKIGYAPQLGLSEHLRNKGFTEVNQFKAGLLSKKDKDNYQEVFKNRLIFPIFDKKNISIGFGARALFKSKAKYINSPNSNLFQKSQILYGISYLNRDYLNQKPLLIVEGYMDVISIFESNLAQALAPLGTSISENQIEEIWKINKKPILCLDGDEAGENAAWRFINRLLPIIKTGKEISFAWLPKNKDPDQMIKNSEEELFTEIIKNPKSLIDTIWDILKKKHNVSNPDSKALFWSEAKKIVNLIKDKNLKQSYSDEIYKKIKNSRNINFNSSSNSTVINNISQNIRNYVGKQNLTDTIFLLLIYHPQLALDFSEKLVKVDFQNKNKNKILLILLDMIITNQNIDRIEFDKHLKSMGLADIVESLEIEKVIKRIGYDPSEATTSKINNYFSDILNRILDKNKRI